MMRRRPAATSDLKDYRAPGGPRKAIAARRRAPAADRGALAGPGGATTRLPASTPTSSATLAIQAINRGMSLEAIARRRGHAALGDQGTSPWLFPGGRPGQPISAYQLAERLRQLGLRPAQSRTTALFGLATELPAAVLARLLGTHIKVAAEWQRASAGDWTTYAADDSHRKPAPAQDAEPALRHADERDAFR